ncbi:helicase-related protein [Rothia sp. P4278]|uniref:helicase-related protein n=1 Tax=Rothia sp. P4278 TaxID=3402658 RepID=UPI003ADC065C
MNTKAFDEHPDLFDTLGVDDGAEASSGTLLGADGRVQGRERASSGTGVGEPGGTLGGSVGVPSNADGGTVRADVGASASDSGDSAATGGTAASADAFVAGAAGGRTGQSNPGERQRSATRADDAGSESGGAEPDRGGKPSSVNFSPGTEIHVPSGLKARARANLDALALVRRLDSEKRNATAEEQQILAGYSSWGAIPQIFSYREDWQELRKELEELLSAEEFAQASRTTLNAHYTDPLIASAMWDALQYAGFDGGTVLEPGCGSGNFIGQAPDSAQMVGVELDVMTAKIAHYLYPSATIRAEGYQKTFIPDGALGAVIGNVPFGDTRLADRVDNRENLSLHNYFIHKSMKHLPAGGYGIFITSTGTMDSKTSKAREVIGEHSDFIGGVRLPSGAFSRVAGTEVATDILIFRRREDGVPLDPAEHERWVRGHAVTGEMDGEQVSIYTSRYFEENKQFVLGETNLGIGGYPPRPCLLVTSDDDRQQLVSRIDHALRHHIDVARDSRPYSPEISRSVSLSALAAGGLVEADEADADTFVGSLRTVGDRGVQVLGEDRTWRAFSAPGRGANRISDDELYRLVQLKETVRAAVDARGDTDEVSRQLELLNTRYDQYVQRYGLINRYTLKAGKVPTEKQQEKAVATELKRWQDTHRELPASERALLSPDEQMLAEWKSEASKPLPDTKIQAHLSALRADPDFGKLVALENFHEAEQKATKSQYFSSEMYQPRIGARAADTPADALAISLDETRTVSLGRIGELLGVSEEEARQQLGSLVFDDPATGELVPAVKYLAGDVRQKLQEAQSAAAEDSRYEANVEQLEAVLPEWATLDKISVQPGVHFVSAEEYRDFAREVLGVDMQIERAADGSWDVPNVSKSKLSTAVLFEFGTSRRTPVDIFQKLMNNRAITVHDKIVEDGKTRNVVNQGETRLARERGEALKERFASWVASDPARAADIETRFNQMYNAYVQPDYSTMGQALTLPGLAPEFVPHPYQREAVARIVNEPSVLLDHVVGAGKTGSMIMGAMELRRTGVAHKPWMVVPNHLTDQISREFSQWYPGAKVLTIPTGISAAERRRFAAMSAGGDWDAVICPQSVFSQIGVSPRRQRQWVQDEIDALRESLSESAGDRVQVKTIEAAIARREARLEKLMSSKVAGITFEETGCDYLFVDEAHHYKNLPRVSDFRELACVGSNKAMDMDFILRTLRDLKIEALKDAGVYNGQLPSVATFATGTPVANSLAEMWVMAHYLRPDITEKMGIKTIDAFGSVFTKAESAVEVKPSGAGFQVVNRISKFTNVQQLMQMAALYTSTVSRDQIPAALPSVVAGGIQAVEREASEHVKAYIDDLVARIENPSADDHVIELLGRARKVALDPRMVGLEADEDGGRPAQVAREVMRIDELHRDKVYLDVMGNESENKGGLQLLFCDWGTPDGAGFNMYKAIKDELVALGMEESRIAFIHQARTDGERGELFARARAGELSVLIGSTEKMGTGMNVQQRVTAVHHVDLPWRPADLEQREGRAIRQGNQNSQVEILSHVTVGTFDAYNWQKLANKAAMLEQLRNHSLGHEVEDLGPMTSNYQELLAVASGNPQVAQWYDLSMAADSLLSLKRKEEQYLDGIRYRLSSARMQLSGVEGSLVSIGQALEFAPSTTDSFVVGRTSFAAKNDEAGATLIRGLRSAAIELGQDKQSRIAVGRIGNLIFTTALDTSTFRDAVKIEFALAGSGQKVLGISESVPMKDLMGGNNSGRGLVMRVWNRAFGLEHRLGELEKRQSELNEEIAGYEQVVEQYSGFARQDELDELLLRRDMLAEELGIGDGHESDSSTVEYVSDADFARIFGQKPSEVDTLGELRPGDIVQITKTPDQPFASGFYSVHLDRNEDGRGYLPMIRPHGDDDAEPGRLIYGVKFELAQRPVDALTQWELALLQVPETDASHAALAGERELEKLGVGAKVSLPAPVLDEQGRAQHSSSGIPLVQVATGSLVSWSKSAQGISYDVVLVDEQGQESTFTVAGRHYGYHDMAKPAFIVRDAYTAEEVAQQKEAEIAAELADRKLIKSDRLYPGDLLVNEVEDVGRAGWMLETYPRGPMKHFADPSTGEKLPGYGVSDFSGEIVPGRDLVAEEREELFSGLAQSMTVGQLRAGDVVDGQKLDSTYGFADKVRVVSISSNGTSSDVLYRPVSSPLWEEPLRVTRRDSTEIGGLIERRFGALSRAERAILGAPGATLVSVEELVSEQARGSYVLVPGISVDSKPGQTLETIGKLLEAHQVERRSIYGRSRYQVIEMKLDIDGEIGTVERSVGSSTKAVVFSEGLPQKGIDFVGTSLLGREREHAVSADVSDLQADRVDLSVIAGAPRSEPVVEVEPEPVELDFERSANVGAGTDDDIELKEGTYLLDDGVLKVSGVDSDDVERLTDGLATLDEENVVRPTGLGADQAQAQALARVALELDGVSGEVRRASARELMIGDAVVVSSGDGAFAFIPELEGKLRETTAGRDAQNVPGEMVGTVVSTDSRRAILNVSFDEHNIEVAVVPTAADMRFEIADAQRAVEVSQAMSQNADLVEQVSAFGSMRVASLETGTLIGLSQVARYDALTGAGELVDVPRAAVLDNRAHADTGQRILLLHTADESFEVIAEDSQLVNLVKIADAKSRAAASFFRWKVGEEHVEPVVDPQVGQQVLVSGEDADTGESVQMVANVADTHSADENGREVLSVETETGEYVQILAERSQVQAKTQDVVETTPAPDYSDTVSPGAADTRSVFDGIAFVDANETIVVSEPRSLSEHQVLSAAQVRVGDLVQVAGSDPLPVYRTAVLNESMVNITVLREGGLASASFPLDQAVNVTRYPESDRTGEHWFTQDIQRVRSGDEIDIYGQRLEVTHTARSAGSVQITGLDDKDQMVSFTLSPITQVGVRIPLCAEDRLGIRAEPHTTTAKDLHYGDVIATKKGDAVVHRVEPLADGHSQRVHFQFIGSKGFSPVHTLIKGNDEMVHVYRQSYQEPVSKSERSTTDFGKPAHVLMDQSRDAGPDLA